MDNKITLQQLAKSLAQKKDLTQKKAEAFLHEFFDAIIQNVTDDDIVKIKGLGTFKRVDVLDRESVNINTGERIVIPGHSKLSFAPDMSLKDLVNKPFADFQTVIINEGTSLEDMERTPSEVPAKTEDEYEPEPDSELVAELETEPEEGEPEEEEAVTEPETAPDPEPIPEAQTGQNQPEEKAREEVAPLVEVNETVRVRAMTTAEKCALTLGVVLLCVMSYFAGYYRLFCSSADDAQGEVVIRDIPPLQEDSAAAPAEADTLLSLPVEEEDSSQVLPAGQESLKTDAAPQPALDPDKEYRITGTRKTHIMKSGDYLTRIALREYGHKDFARYIIEYNDFRNPDNVPIGAEVKLPELKLAE